MSVNLSKIQTRLITCERATRSADVEGVLYENSETEAVKLWVRKLKNNEQTEALTSREELQNLVPAGSSLWAIRFTLHIVI